MATFEPRTLVVIHADSEEQNLTRTQRLYAHDQITLEEFEWRVGLILAAGLP